MGDILTTAFGNVLGEIIVTISGLIITGITTFGAIYMKKLSTKLKNKMLRDEINRYVDFAEKAKSFSELNIDEKIQTVYEKAREFANENEIKISDTELMIWVERSLAELRSLENKGQSIMMLNRQNKPQGE
jgi:uncharacterized membrane protein